MKEREKRSALLLIFVMGSLLYGLAFLCLVKEPGQYSYSERRLLAQFPQLSLKKLTDGSFPDEFEVYSQDQFPFRETFRRGKAAINGRLLRRLDEQGIYRIKGHLGKLDYPLHNEQLDHALERMNEIYYRYLAGKENRIYLAVIPDKNYYLAEPAGYPVLDYETLFQKVKTGMEYASFIDLRSSLEIDDFYFTDTHWRQEKLLPIAKLLLEAMGGKRNAEYRKEVATREFLGVYAGQSAQKEKAEEIVYLTNEVLEDCVVTIYDEGGVKEKSMYDPAALSQKDPYEFFLHGNQALVEIHNPHADTTKELILFRDSFGSSLAPLLAEEYSRITLVDIRYLRSRDLGNYLTFTDQDVLFLYSSLLLNNSLSMK